MGAHFKEPADVALVTTPGPDGHTHVAVFNARGNGHTTEAADGHHHRVIGLEVQPLGPKGHTHELTEHRAALEDAPSGSGRWGPRERERVA